MLKSVVHFVAQIHAIPTAEATAAGIGPSDTNRDASWWRTFRADLTTTLYPLLMRHQRDHVDDLFAPVLDGALTFGHRPTLAYGDVASYHLLVDTELRRIAHSATPRLIAHPAPTSSAWIRPIGGPTRASPIPRVST